MPNSFNSLSLATFGYVCPSGSGSTGSVPPGNVLNLIATSRTTQSILLTWKPATMTEYYQVQRALSSTGSFSIISPQATDVYLIDSSLSAGFYWYRVLPINNSRTGNYSSIAYARTVQVGATDDGGLLTASQQSDKLNRSESLFFNDRQWQFVKHRSAQMVNHIMKQQVYYYEMDESTMSGRNKIYGERRKKIWKAPKKLYGRVMRDPVASDRKNFGYTNQHSIKVYFDKNHLDRLKVDPNFMVGNQIEWDHKSFLIRTMRYFDSVKGLSDYKMTIVVTAVYTQD